MFNSQVKIISLLQEKLLAAISPGDWSATKQWADNLSAATLVYEKLLSTEDVMALKEKIETLASAVVERDNQITTLNQQLTDLKSMSAFEKEKVTELEEADAAADKAIAQLKLST